MKKRLISAALTMAMTMGLMAGSVQMVSAEEKRSDLTIGMTIPAVSSDFMVALSDILRGYLEGQGHKVQFDSADGDVNKQIIQVENDIQMGCDALVIWPVNGEGMANVVQQAVDQGIPVLAFAIIFASPFKSRGIAKT